MLKSFRLAIILASLTAIPAGANAAGSPDNNASALGDSKAIETAQPAGNNAEPARDLLVRVEILLDRANFSPGEIDGKSGDNLSQAIAAYRQAHGLSGGNAIDGDLMKALLNDHAPVLQQYTISADDEKGPFLGNVPKDFKALAKLKHVGYANPQEMLAEKFHMSASLLRELNPDVDFAKAGSAITVAKAGGGQLPAVARVEVDKGQNEIRAYDDSGKVVAMFPATVGSTDRPAPSGKAVVVAVAPNPTYTYDPSRLTFGPKHTGKLTIKPGPNNPVGSTWIALNIQTYGIHGTPDPQLVGKTASHGCVRLTNWDAVALARL